MTGPGDIKRGAVVGLPVIPAICILWIFLGSAPVLVSAFPLPTLGFFAAHPVSQLAGKALLLVLLAAAARFVCQHDPEPLRTRAVRYCGFALLAALLTDLHYHTVDKICIQWQYDQYAAILAHTCLPPDQYRFISQGILWWMALGNGDFVFSYVIYRFFFTFLLCLSIYRLARLYLPAGHSVLIVFLYGAFYPLSTRYYYGNLLDPTSHLVMLSAFYYARQQRFWTFFSLFVLGMFIKETMLLLAPCYWLMNLETSGLRQHRNLPRITLLAFVGALIFLACRIPFHFRFDFATLNRTDQSMIYANLGLPGANYLNTAPLFQRYLHPFLFLFMWLPLIIWQRRRLPVSLFWTAIYFAATLYLTNLFFSWNHESRNFVPGLVMLLICTMIILKDWVDEEPAAVAARAT
jgi:hypothetical protein